jgi:branched-chain amino acid transport system permease protein
MKLLDLRFATLIACAGVLVFAPFLFNPGLLFLVGLTLVQALFALSWNLLFRYAGVTSFGHAMFYGVGAYCTAAVTLHHIPIPFLVTMLLSVVLGTAAAFVVGVIALARTSGIQLAVLTLALSQLAVLLVSYSDFLGRDDGLSGLSRPRLDFGAFSVDLVPTTNYYYFMLLVCAAVTIGLLWLVSGPRGRMLLAVATDAERASFLGIDVRRQRIAAFSLAGGVAALSGSLVAPWTQIITTDSMSWLNAAQPMLATLLGGAGFFWGPVIGAFALTLISYFTRIFAGLSEISVGGILLAIVLIAPAGLYGFGLTVSTRFRSLAYRSVPAK